MLDNPPISLSLIKYVHGERYEVRVSISESTTLSTISEEELIYLLARKLANKMINELGTLKE